jgi:hypothetical protein
MRVKSSVLFVLACCGAYGQGVNQAQSSLPPGVAPITPVPVSQPSGQGNPPAFPTAQMRGRYLSVKDYMRYPSPLSPIGDGNLSMMGDEAAFHLYTIMITMPPLTAAQTLTVLDIIHNSFKAPVFIQSHADRKPNKSLALLKMLQATAVDQVVKERIATETTFLNSLPEKITPVPILNLPSKPGVLPMREDFPNP